MSIKHIARAGFTGLALILTACAGGGGGDAPIIGAAPPPPPPPSPPPPALPAGVTAPPAVASAFTSWSAISDPSRTQLTGIGLATTWTHPQSSNTGFFADWSPPIPDTPKLTVARYSDGNLAGIGFTMAGVSGGHGGSYVANNGLDCCRIDFNGLTLARQLDYDLDANWAGGFSAPAATGQNYQTYGAWEVDSSNGNGLTGAFVGFSVGAATPSANLPTAGAAQFNGDLYGVSLIGGHWDEIASTVSLDVDFANRSAVFSSGDLRTSKQTLTGTALSGVLSYAAGSNALSGTLTTANGLFRGPSVGQFYGPAAEEVGGAFSLTTSVNDQDHIVGGFGAKR